MIPVFERFETIRSLDGAATGNHLLKSIEVNVKLSVLN